MKKHIFHICLFVLAGNFLLGQVPMDKENKEFLKTVTEQVQFYTDRDLYLAGEEVWFTAYMLINNSFDQGNLSKVVYVELFDSNKKKRFQGKFEINNARASGSFKIPAEVLTATYFIRAYTQYQRNFLPDLYATKQITIINPEFSLPEQKSFSDTSKNKINLTSENLENTKQKINGNIEIKVIADKTVYKKREPVELKFQIPSGDIAGLNVSVVRRGTMRQTEGFTSTETNNVKISENGVNSLFWIPETRGVSISGTVTEKKSMATVAGVNIYLSVLGEDAQMHITKTTENGAFAFSLGYISGSQEIFIGIDPGNEKGLQLFVNNDFSNEFPELKNIPASIDTTYKSLIEEMLVNLQSKKILSQTIEKKNEKQTIREIFGQADISIRLSDYIDLPNLENIFYELVPTVTIRNSEGKKVLNVLNPKIDMVFPNQLLLLDHVPIFDVEAMLSITPVKIENIDVFNRVYYLGDNILNNVIMVDTKEGDFGGYEFQEGSAFVEYQTFGTSKKFEIPTYASLPEKKFRIPDFRTLLYWNPELIVSGNDTTLSFYTSDNTGDYDIYVRGITKEGNHCFGHGSIRIE